MSYVPIHRVKSRPVTDRDMKRVRKDALKMIAMCAKPSGVHKSAMAIAHSQICDKDPLRFFVRANGYVIVNPTITRHVNFKKRCEEGCMSIPAFRTFGVQRWNKIEVEYTVLQGDGFVPVHEELRGIEAQMFQHEIDHMDAKYVNDSV